MEEFTYLFFAFFSFLNEIGLFSFRGCFFIYTFTNTWFMIYSCLLSKLQVGLGNMQLCFVQPKVIFCTPTCALWPLTNTIFLKKSCLYTSHTPFKMPHKRHIWDSHSLDKWEIIFLKVNFKIDSIKPTWELLDITVFDITTLLKKYIV